MTNGIEIHRIIVAAELPPLECAQLPVCAPALIKPDNLNPFVRIRERGLHQEPFDSWNAGWCAAKI